MPRMKDPNRIPLVIRLCADDVEALEAIRDAITGSIFAKTGIPPIPNRTDAMRWAIRELKARLDRQAGTLTDPPD